MHSGRCLCFGPSFQWSDNVKLGFDNLLRSPSHQTQLHGQARNVLPWLCGCRLISIFFLSLISTPWYRVQREVNFIALYSCLIRNNQEPLCFGLILRNVVTRRFLLSFSLELTLKTCMDLAWAYSFSKYCSISSLCPFLMTLCAACSASSWSSLSSSLPLRPDRSWRMPFGVDTFRNSYSTTFPSVKIAAIFIAVF